MRHPVKARVREILQRYLATVWRWRCSHLGQRRLGLG
jgi:hypothetical protein